MTTEQFIQEFRRASEAATGRRAYLPGEMVEAWEQVVDFCYAGYDDCLDEYIFDLGVRGSLDVVLRDPGLQEFSELRQIQHEVARIDDRFRSILQDEPISGLADWPWWESHPPRFAGAELAADFLDRYGVSVEVR